MSICGEFWKRICVNETLRAQQISLCINELLNTMLGIRFRRILNDFAPKSRWLRKAAVWILKGTWGNSGRIHWSLDWSLADALSTCNGEYFKYFLGKIGFDLIFFLPTFLGFTQSGLLKQEYKMELIIYSNLMFYSYTCLDVLLQHPFWFWFQVHPLETCPCIILSQGFVVLCT